MTISQRVNRAITMLENAAVDCRKQGNEAAAAVLDVSVESARSVVGLINAYSEASDKSSPDMYSHMGGTCRGDDLGESPD